MLVASPLGCAHPTTTKPQGERQPQAAQAIFDDAAYVELDERLRTAQIEYGIPVVALAVVAHGEVVYAKTLEIAEDRAHTSKSERNYLFPLSSTTKTLTSTAVALAIEDGPVSWTSSLASLMPMFSPSGETSDWPSPTIEALLSHQSGFIRMGPVWGDGQRTLDEVIETVSHAAPVRPPGEAFEYNNVMFSLGVVATARAGGSAWSEMLAQRVLDPLGMSETYVPGRAVIDGATTVPGYSRDPQTGALMQMPVVDRENIGPAGGVDATLADMARWTMFVVGRGEIDGQRLVSPEIMELLWQPRVWAWPGAAYGLGWFIKSWHGRRMVTHDGNSDYGYSSTFVALPDDGVGFVLLCNVNYSPLQGEIVDIVLDRLEPGLEPSPEWEVPLPAMKAAERRAATDLPPIELLEPAEAMVAGDEWLETLRSPKRRGRAIRRLGEVRLEGESRLVNLGTSGPTFITFSGAKYERTTDLREIALAGVGYTADQAWYRLRGGADTPIADPVLNSAVRRTSYVSLHGDLLGAFSRREVVGRHQRTDVGETAVVRLSNADDLFEIFVEISVDTGDIVVMWESEGTTWIETEYDQFVDMQGVRLPLRERIQDPYLGRIETVFERSV